MAQQPPSIRVRSQDFPEGMSRAEHVEQLGTLLNPVLRSLSVLGANGVNLAGNVDASIVSFPVTTPTSDWTDFAVSGWANAGGAYPNFGWRRDSVGDVFLRGRINTLPALATTLATLPALSAPASTLRFAVDAAGAYGAIEITSAGIIKQVVGSILGTLDLSCAFAAVSSAPGVLSVWPQSIRINPGRRPSAVWLMNARDSTQAPGVTPPMAATGVQWSYLGTAPGKPNYVSIDNVPGLPLARSFVLTVLVTYA